MWSSSVSGLFSIGADQSGSYSIVSGIDGGAVVTTGGAAVSSDGVGVTYEVVDGTTVRGVAGGETVFEVVLDGTTGDYTFTLLGQLDHHAVLDADDVEGVLSLDLSGTIEVSDEDGDRVGLGAGSLVITVQDDVPVAEDAVEQGYVEEESLPGGNEDSDDVAGINDDGDGNNGVWSSSVSGLFSIGADQSGSYSIVSGIDGGAVVTTGGAAVSSDGVGVTYEVVDGTTVRGVAGGETVFEVVLDGTTGDYTFTLLGQLDHHAVLDADDVEGVLSLDLSGTIEVSDEDGDRVGLGAGSLVITVQDDVPVTEVRSTGLCGRRVVTGGNEDSDDVAGINDDGDGNNGVWSSSVSGLFSIGADQSGSYSIVSGIDGGAVVTTGGAAVSSDGVGVTYEVVDGTTVRGVAGGETVFEVVLDGTTGDYTFTLLGQLDHHAVLDADDVEGVLSLDLSGTIEVSDEDGDRVGLGAGSLVITVQDDVPVTEDAVEQGYVEEESLPGGNEDSDDVAGINDDGDGNNGVWSSSVSGLFSIGADQSGSYSIVSGIDGGAVVTTGGAAVSSDGVGVTYEVVDGTTVRGVAGGETVFEVVLDGTTGDYTFTLLGQLDHHAVLDADDVEGLLSLDLSGTIEASDEDGDTVGLGDGSLVITVQDDIPVAEDAVEQGYVEEESLPDGNDDSDDVAGIDGDGDGNNGVWSSSVSGLFSIGADQSGSYSIVSGIDGGAVLTTGGAAVSSDGVAVTYEVVDATTVRGVAGGETVFEVVLDGTTGDYTFTLLGQLDHHAVLDADDVEGLLSLDLSGTIEASDEDGDRVGLGAGSLVITVQDDVPVTEDAVEQGYVEEVVTGW
ncbi:DUF5801 domain-containing protein [Prosthecochloris sp. SCSIO W1101]|uniref:T1SS-143 repeat domain-containing protein n=1 Tax=Prosthecochloris sp. SCSIO W1101 TaxID=2992242 RepID=UPI00223D9028|nr:DUF5801 repeats-in-toxin domain-containing protein [Prosthecochloris sp. SCSIO W1101]UZJ42249.1 DUF5801 domain-containing protein [Prosthecochloris sp. SCSIO W1101]